MFKLTCSQQFHMMAGTSDLHLVHSVHVQDQVQSNLVHYAEVVVDLTQDGPNVSCGHPNQNCDRTIEIMILAFYWLITCPCFC